MQLDGRKDEIRFIPNYLLPLLNENDLTVTFSYNSLKFLFKLMMEYDHIIKLNLEECNRHPNLSN